MTSCFHRYNYQHVNCDSRVGSAVITGLVGCTAKLGLNIAFCGAQIDRVGPDFLASSISSSSLDFPRVLTTEGVVNGVVTPRIECFDPLDCDQKCTTLARTSRNGLDIPPGAPLVSQRQFPLYFTSLFVCAQAALCVKVSALQMRERPSSLR